MSAGVTGEVDGQGTVRLPSDPSGTALAAVIAEVRHHLIAHGGVVIDTSPARQWSPGARLVIIRLRNLAERTGATWVDVSPDTPA